MDTHLKYISKEYEQDCDDRGVYPISEQDCQIITELIDILRLNNNNQLAQILSRWKDDSDNQILDQLLEYQHDQDVNEEGDDNRQNTAADFVTIQKDCFRVAHIHNIRTKEYYDNESNRIKYLIVVNDTQSGEVRGAIIINTDIIYSFNSEGVRNEYLKDIRKRLVKYKKIKFI